MHGGRCGAVPLSARTPLYFRPATIELRHLGGVACCHHRLCKIPAQHPPVDTATHSLQVLLTGKTPCRGLLSHLSAPDPSYPVPQPACAQSSLLPGEIRRSQEQASKEQQRARVSNSDNSEHLAPLLSALNCQSSNPLLHPVIRASEVSTVGNSESTLDSVQSTR